MTDDFAKDLTKIYIDQVFINFSRRSVKIVDSDGYDDTIEWKWNEEGANGFWKQ